MNTKVILNQDFVTLGEEGDVKEVARGYARNYLFPRSIALPYTKRTIQLFEARRADIETRKELKRKDALGIKEKLEALQLAIIMPAGLNGKLYGAVTNLTVSDELGKLGFLVERKRIEVPGNGIKTVGKYKIIVKLYGSASAEMNLTVEAAEVKTETKETHSAERRHKHDKDAVPSEEKDAGDSPLPESAAVETPAE
ncbi:MAG: 50S ribosomal protein L9 [Spirochaetaceae bacterium]|jgi:large subunit ribosomal protein L9|nr:50S ribosomal protein L9 [Spirochaetaceae bacterium]